MTFHLREWRLATFTFLLVFLQLSGVHAKRSGTQNSTSVPVSNFLDSIHNGALLGSTAADNCFNCLLPAYTCTQYSDCRQYDGRCECPPGFGGDDCSVPVCGSLAGGRDRMPRSGHSCECDDGWEGLNCNVCANDDACNAFMPDGTGGACYTGGMAVKENFQMCNVTNRKILDILEGKLPQVTFSCNRTSESCNFQFWIDEIESFYCGLNNCDFTAESTGTTNKTSYECKDIECACLPDRMLCGEDGSIDITDFLNEAITGPGTFSCDSARGSCEFSEPAMDDLIQSVFGDETITLTCNSGECMHYSELPGYEIPKKSLNKRVLVLGIIGIVIFIVLVSLGLFYLVRKMQDLTNGANLPSEDESYKLMSSHTPATLLFDNVTYTVGNKRVLHGVQGVVRPGEIMAVMGASGAGKTSLLDILAHKNKGGVVGGDILVNGFKVSESQFKSISGFVDQEDALMPTLTVYETILNSALLRLPKAMSRNAKRLRVLETMNELGIMGIKDQVIGWEGHRGISGGEKRRVAIACELVTSPSILFLDEPTSGLDSFNAYNVVECLQSLARDYKRTVIFTIHQPRSNIVALFDRLILLSHGQLVYSGLHDNCQEYFDSIGYECPSGFNLADFLIDLTMKASKSLHPSNGYSTHLADNSEGDLDSTAEVAHEDGELIRLETRSTDDNSTTTPGNGNHTQYSSHEDLVSDLDDIVRKYKESGIAERIKTEIQETLESASAHSDRLPAFLYGGQKIGIFEQFVILSGRTFKNLYRDPMLLLTHYIMALVLAVLCGYLYYDISNDISGFQNRLGLFFFLLALFGFSTLTSLHVFASERQIFVRERANGFYVPISYFASKVAFDIIPLRVFPPVMLGLIIYPLVGLNFENHGMLKFLLVLTLFNLAAAAICLCIGVMIKDIGVASLIGSLVMLFSLLFAGLFLNKDSIPKGALWIQNLSIFHYAFEAMAVNEVRYLTLIEYKYGLSIEVPGATILSTFGFNTTAYRSDATGLVVFFTIFIVFAYIGMHYILVERR
ncbi:hypothetical protein POJ06DRAFT_106161 [Lipomyces tetrasporus]|uniref:ABC transporter domain-containing protein n=1 Tax=Lipomyces tetrasporus TaxID=54092 RepID=A0AAD7QSK6_9ASCO|nr:uncharacterized protein POJ06DRAFT_106161 [Lipomyces tetrasporus]KAJ8100531.1 hypothetical protein POJ06DRAFT_106161 [Lipomyces tetrasporus]